MVSEVEPMVNAVNTFFSPSKRIHGFSWGFCLLSLIAAGVTGVFFTPEVANGATYYVDDANGRDTNPGTSWEQAWKSLTNVYNVAAGNTVYFKSGNYGAFSKSFSANRTDWTTYKSATGHAPVFTKINISNSTAYDVYLKFDGINIQQPSYTPPDDGHWHYLDANAPGYLVYTNKANYLQFLNGSYKGCNHYISRGVNIVSSNNVTIQRCEVATVEGTPINLEPSDNVIIRNCYAHDFVNASGIRIQGTITSALFENNHLFCSPMDPNEPYYPYWEKINNPTSIHSGSGFSIRSSHITIRKNIVHGEFAQGLMFYDDFTYHDMIVENNLFYDTGPVRISRLNGACVIRNNTGIGYINDTRINRGDLILGRYVGQPLNVVFAVGFNGNGVEIYNNICVGYWGLPGDPNLPFSEDYNLIWRLVNDTNIIKGSHSKIVVWEPASTLHGWPNYFEDIGYRSSTAEYSYAIDGIQPFFVDPNFWTDMYYQALRGWGRGKLYDYHLASGSPGINFGDPANQPSDSLGSLDPNGFIKDDGPPRDASHHSAGCYEYIPPDPNNHAPVIQSIGSKSVNENSLLTFTVIATDADNDAITYSATGLPTGATFSGQTFSWTPGYDQAGTYNVTFVARDEHGTQSSPQTVTITVNNVNRPPVLAAIGNKSVSENITLSFSVSATDPDGDTVTYSYSGLPVGASFSSQTFNWTPTYAQTGTYQITFTASDGQAQDFETVTITVKHVNRPPVLSAIGNKSVYVDDILPFSVSATDPDGDTVQFSADGSPSGATFASQSFNWQPVSTQVGSHQVTFVASDGELQDSETITITVFAADTAPPSVTNCSPAADSIQVPLNSLIILHITDAGKGVDAGSVAIKVNDNVIYSGDTLNYSSACGNCRRSGTKADYAFVYQSNAMFDFDQLVSVTANAADLAGNAMSQHSYSFRTEMRSFGQNKKVSSGSDTLTKAAPATVWDSAGNIWAAWHAGPVGSRDIYVGKLAAGADNFGSSVRLTESTADQCNPAVAVGSDDKLYVIWQDNRTGTWDIYVSISSDGVSWSAEKRVTDTNDNQVNPAIAVDTSNRAYIVWQDDRNVNQDIYIATSSNGFVTETVSQITSNIADQIAPAIAVDSSNTVYVVWTEARSGSSDIYGACSNSGPWTNVPIVNNAGNQSSPAIAAESEGSILHLLWVDDRSGNQDIYYATSNGLPSSPLSGSSIIDDTSAANQSMPVIVTSSSKVFACWQDQRNVSANGGDTDLYLTELTSGSRTNILVGDDGTNADQSEPAIGIGEYGHPYLVWTDDRSTNTEIYYAGSTFVEPVALTAKDVSVSLGAVVGTEPASISSVDDVSIVVPASAYSCDIRITISKIKNPPAFAMQCLGSYDFGPSGMQFSQPVTVTIPYTISSSVTSASAYWYNSLTRVLNQLGMTDVENLQISSTLYALRFKTTHFTPLFLFGDSTEGDDGGEGDDSGGGSGGGGGGGGGGCSISAGGEANFVEFLLPYIGLAIVMVILKLRDRQNRKSRNNIA
jgi:hypothetical protein